MSVQQLDEVIDTDFHIDEPLEEIISYINEPFKSQFDNSPHNPLHGLFPSPGGYNNYLRGYNETREVNTKMDIEKQMKSFNTDRVVVTPGINLYLTCVVHDGIATALANAYNSWLIDQITDEDKGIFGAAVVAPQKPIEAAEEIKSRCDEPEIVASIFSHGGMNPLAGDKKYHPIYEACETNNLPLLMHAASGNMLWSFPHVYQMFNRTLPQHLNSHPMLAQVTISDMITQGIPVRFPDLNVVIQESGIGWIPFFMRRFDLEHNNHEEDAPMLEKKPSEYITDNFYFTSQPVEGASDPKYLEQIIRLFDGSRNLMYSSDYPHFDFDNVNTLFKALKNFSSSDVNNIYSKTALRVFDF